MPRPQLNPTDEQRRLVKFLVGMGAKQIEIAQLIGIRSDKTLRRHFREEINRGVLEANARAAQTLSKKIGEGNVTASIFWLKCRGNWREEGPIEPKSPVVAPFNVTLELEKEKP
jgi:hypothetical protein